MLLQFPFFLREGQITKYFLLRTMYQVLNVEDLKRLGAQAARRIVFRISGTGPRDSTVVTVSARGLADKWNRMLCINGKGPIRCSRIL